MCGYVCEHMCLLNMLQLYDYTSFKKYTIVQAYFFLSVTHISEFFGTVGGNYSLSIEYMWVLYD